ncbi:MAG: DUF2062 domain-containing protein [Planctomycetaceae bacterium]|nr:DUF2062 domain-containing protein [Planctomycetaceae bacterium]
MNDVHPIRKMIDPRMWLRALLMLDGTSHQIALGAAIGMFIALTPTVGVQMVLVMLIAMLTRRLFRFNKVAALIAVYISNPLTVVPIYWFNYTIGTIYFPSTITKEEFAKLFEYDGLSEWWASMTRLFVDLGVPLLTGSFVVATMAGLITYPLLLRLLRRMKMLRHRERRMASNRLAKEQVHQKAVRV